MPSKIKGTAQAQWKTRLDEIRVKHNLTEFYPPCPDWNEFVMEGDRKFQRNHMTGAICSYQSACELMGVGERETLNQLAAEGDLHPWMLKPLIKLTEAYDNLLDGEAFRAHARLAELMAKLQPMYENLAHPDIQAKLRSFCQCLQKHGPEVNQGNLVSFESIRLLAREMDANFASAMNSGFLLPMKSVAM